MPSTKRVIGTASGWLSAALDEHPNRVLLTSPYLVFDICKRIADAAQESRGDWTLVTALDPSAVANGYLSVQGLFQMLDAGVNVRHVDRLHAKCFIVGSKGILGSANLTGAGLGSSARPNRELDVELDPSQIAEAREAIESWPYRSVERDDLNKLIEQSRALTKTTQEQRDALSPESALHLAETILEDAREDQRSLWLKLEYGQPALVGWQKPSWFASPKKGKPGFKPGDLVFICAKDTHDCYAVVEVTSEPEFQPDDYVKVVHDLDRGAEVRWPWVNRTIPRLVPADLMELKLTELGVNEHGLQNGHVRLRFDQFTTGVRSLARLATD